MAHDACSARGRREAVDGVGGEHDPPVTVDVEGHGPHGALGPLVGVVLGRPLVGLAHRQQCTREAPLDDAGRFGQRDPHGAARAAEHPRRADGSAGELGPGPPGPGDAEVLVRRLDVGAHAIGDVLERQAELDVGRDRGAGGGTDGRRRMRHVDPGVAEGEQDAGADADGDRTAATDHQAEAGVGGWRVALRHGRPRHPFTYTDHMSGTGSV